MNNEEKNVSPITTYGGWAVILLLGLVAYQKYITKNNPRLAAKQPARQQRTTDAAALSSDAKKKAEKAVKPKPKPKAPATANVATSSSVNYVGVEDTEAAERKADREFARQLASAHSGTKFSAKKSDEKRQKSVKQSKAEEVLGVPEKPSAPSSHAGDADDDLSPPTSPTASAVNGQDVSDTLEPAPAGPSAIATEGVPWTRQS